MLTEPQARAWADGLATTPLRRIAAIAELLRYGPGDGMTADDRTVCVRQMRRIADEAKIDVDGVLRECFRSKYRGDRRPK